MGLFQFLSRFLSALLLVPIKMQNEKKKFNNLSSSWINLGKQKKCYNNKNDSLGKMLKYDWKPMFLHCVFKR